MSDKKKESTPKEINLSALINSDISSDISNLYELLQKLNIALKKLNLEYQYMCEERASRGEI